MADRDIALCLKEVKQSAIHKETGLWMMGELIELVPKIVLESESDTLASAERYLSGR